MMLIVSFIALVMACVLMSLELSKWGPYPHWKSGAPNATSSLQWSEDIPSLVTAEGLNAPVNFPC